MASTRPEAAPAPGPAPDRASDPASGWTPTARRLGWAIVAVGALLRLRQYLANRSLWRDEASLVYNILHRSYSGLTKPLSFDQGSPPGFLFAEKAITQVFGSSELALRALPLAASVAALAVLLVLLRRHLDARAGLITVALCATSPWLIYYATEVKQYSTDVLVAELILLAGSTVWRRRYDTASCVGLALVGMVALFCSHATLFVLAPVGLVLAWPVLRDRNQARLVRLLAVAAAWALTLIPVYLIFDRSLDDNAYLRHFWAQAFLPIPPTDNAGLQRWVTSLATLFGMLSGVNGLTVVLAPLAVAGMVVLWRRNRGVLAVLLGPWVLVVIASSFKLYPATERLVLFLVPLLAVLVGTGTGALFAWIRPRSEMAAVLVVAVVLVLNSAVTLRRITHPVQEEELRPLLTEMRAEFRPGDAIYVNQTAVPAFDYYRGRLHLPPAQVILGTADFDDERALGAEVAPLDKPGARVWVLTSAYWAREGHILPVVTATMGRIGHLVSRFDAVGSSISLYRIDSPARTEPGGG